VSASRSTMTATPPPTQRRQFVAEPQCVLDRFNIGLDRHVRIEISHAPPYGVASGVAGFSLIGPRAIKNACRILRSGTCSGRQKGAPGSLHSRLPGRSRVRLECRKRRTKPCRSNRSSPVCATPTRRRHGVSVRRIGFERHAVYGDDGDPFTACGYCVIDDPDAHFERARAAGADIVTAPHANEGYPDAAATRAIRRQ